MLIVIVLPNNLSNTLPSTMLGHPKFETAQPHLLIAGQVICCRLIPALCQAAVAPEYWEYLISNLLGHRWTFSSIHWTALASALGPFQCNDQSSLSFLSMTSYHSALPNPIPTMACSSALLSASSRRQVALFAMPMPSLVPTI